MTAGAGTEQLIIVGSGVAGLALALGAGRAGLDVTLLERDPAPPAPSVEAAFEATRRGAPQVHQTHGFLARLTSVLRERYPDILQALLEAGARELPLTRELGEPRPGDEELAILVLRRTTLEWVLRRAVLAEPNVSVRSGIGVVGLLADASHPAPIVRGARLDDGSEISGTVAACTGRRGDVPAWLAAIGVAVDETVHETHLVYLTRWYRQLSDEELILPPRLGGDLGFLKYLAVPCDGGTFSVTLAVPVSDAELRSSLQDPEWFEATCRVLTGPDEFFRHGELEALGPVLPMGGLVNRIRRFTTSSGEPRVAGFHAVGDAHTCTNPLYGRGCALAFVQATLLVDAFAAHPGDLLARAAAYEAANCREVEPWYHGAVEWDRYRPGQRNGDGNGESPSDVFARVAAEGGTDPVIGRAIIRLFNLLTRPDQLLTDPEFMARVAPIVANPNPKPPPAPEGPSREEVLALGGSPR